MGNIQGMGDERLASLRQDHQSKSFLEFIVHFYHGDHLAFDYYLAVVEEANSSCQKVEISRPIRHLLGLIIVAI